MHSVYEPVTCAVCGEPCEFVHWKIRVPSPAKRRDWDRFWAEYRTEKELLSRFHRGELREPATFRILNMWLKP
jgi:hypothetical protein